MIADGPGGRRRDLLPGRELAQEALPADGEVRIDRDGIGPGVGHLAGDRDERPAAAPRATTRGRPGSAAARRSHGTSGRVRSASRGCRRPAPRRAARAGGRRRRRGAGRARSPWPPSHRPRRSPPSAARACAVVSEAYVTPPPSRQPRGSSGDDVATRPSRRGRPRRAGGAMAPPRRILPPRTDRPRGSRRVLLRAA